MNNLSISKFSFEIGLIFFKKLRDYWVTYIGEIYIMAQNFQEFKRTMAKLDAQLKKEEAERKARKESKTKKK